MCGDTTRTLGTEGHAFASRMSLFPRVASSTDLAIMIEAHERYCLEHGIEDEFVRADVARLVLMLFKNGAKTVKDLTEALNQSRNF